MKLTQNQYFGLREELPVNFSEGTTYMCIDTGEHFVYNKAKEPILAPTPSSNLVENATVTTSYEIDWAKDTLFLTLTGNTTFTETNLPLEGETKVITIYMDGNFTPTFPTAWTTNYTIIGAYDGLKNNQIVIEFIKTGYYWVVISQDT